MLVSWQSKQRTRPSQGSFKKGSLLSRQLSNGKLRGSQVSLQQIGAAAGELIRA